MTSAVDWNLATTLATNMVPAGPHADGATLSRLVADLRQHGTDAAIHAAKITGLGPAQGSTATSHIRVIDRPSWIVANVQIFEKLSGSLPADANPLTAQIAAAEVAAALAYLSTRVLGQFDPYTSTAGRLLLVAPNVLQIERELDVNPTDFRLWVALHEQTHALQFAAAPWLASHLQTLADQLSQSLLGDVHTMARFVRRLPQTWQHPDGIAVALTPAQRTHLDQLNAVMALLEGHADVTMDQVGTDIIGSLPEIRNRFENHRDQTAESTGLMRVMRTLLGLDMKLAQYRDGAKFVRHLQKRVGVSGFNQVWSSPERLPTPVEIADPESWISRNLP